MNPSSRSSTAASAAASGQRRMRTAASARQSRWSMLVSVTRSVCAVRQANYRAMKAVAQVGVGEFDVRVVGVDLDAQVDVALAHLDEIGAGAQAPRERLRLVALDEELGRVFDQRFGFERAAARRATGRRPRRQRWRRGDCAGFGKNCVASSARNPSSVRRIRDPHRARGLNSAKPGHRRFSTDAATAHEVRAPYAAMPMFTGTYAGPQSKIEKVGRVCSKSLIENSFRYDSPR